MRRPELTRHLSLMKGLRVGRVAHDGVVWLSIRLFAHLLCVQMNCLRELCLEARICSHCRGRFPIQNGRDLHDLP